MIKKLHIRNFQSHKDSRLIFSDGVNVIVGNSDSGKSAILRALNWVITNRPSGDSYISNWGGPTYVIVETEEGTVIRERGKKNRYIIDGIVDSAMGQSVPEPASKILNINSTNMQKQFDAPFLLSMTPGERGRFVNELINLDIIDRGTSNVKKQIRVVDSQIKQFNEQLQSIENQLESFLELNDIEEKVKKLKILQKEFEHITIEADQLYTVIDEIKKYESSLQKLSYVDAIELRVGKICDSWGRCLKIKQHRETLAGIVSKIDWDNECIAERQEMLNEFEKQFKKLMPKICPLCGK